MSFGIELSHLGSIFFFPDASRLITVDYAQRLTDEPAVVDIVFFTVGQLVNLIFLPSGIDAGRPFERTCLNVYGVQCKVDTDIGSLTYIGIRICITVQGRDSHFHQQVCCTGSIEIQNSRDSSVQYRVIDTDIVLCSLFPCQILVCHSYVTVLGNGLGSHKARSRRSAERIIYRHYRTFGLVRVDSRVTGHTDTDTQFQLINPVNVLQETFLVKTPA